MKELHPSAHVISANGELTGFIVHRAGTRKEKLKSVEPAVYVPLERFEQLVREDRVQIFQVVDGKTIPRWTKEERAEFKGLPELSPEEYYNSDSCMYDTLITTQDGISVSLIYTKKMFKVCLVAATIYRPVSFGLDEQKLLARNRLISQPIAPNLLTIQGVLDNVLQFLEATGNYVRVCGHTMSNLDNIFYKHKHFGMTDPTPEEVAYVVQMFKQRERLPEATPLHTSGVRRMKLE